MIAATAAASTSLRETAKWLVAGVTASAVAIFAGSSLTKLGSLDFTNQPCRLSLAIGGLAFGFAGLAYIFARAIAVLTVESLSFRTLTEGTKPRIAAIRDRMESAHRGMMPGNAANFADLLLKTDAARDKTDATSRAVMADYAVFRPMIMAQSGFLYVKLKFDALIVALWIGGPMAVIGCGLFAWAANPPDAKPPAPKPPLLIINQP